MQLILEQRYKRFVFDDPMRRCYNGAYGAHHYEWREWEVLESNVPPERVDDKLKFWREINDFSVSQRGESAKREFRIKEEDVNEDQDNRRYATAA